MKKYPSRFSQGKFVNEFQYILQLICQKNASQTQRELPPEFLNEPQWKTFWGAQLKKCSQLLKSYSSESIIKALNDPRAKKIYSLHAKWLIPIIQEYENKLAIKLPPQDKPDMQGSNFLREQYKKENLLDKLDDEA